MGRIKSEIKLFGRIWAERKDSLQEWIYYNLFIGLCPIWLSWIPLAFGLQFGAFLRPLRDGTVLIFVVTLTGASLGFFAEGTGRELRKTKTLLWMGLFATVLAASAGFSASIAAREFFAKQESMILVGLYSVIMLVVAVALNLHLAAVRILYSEEDPELLERVIRGPAEDLAKAASKENVVDGVAL